MEKGTREWRMQKVKWRKGSLENLADALSILPSVWTQSTQLSPLSSLLSPLSPPPSRGRTSSSSSVSRDWLRSSEASRSASTSASEALA